MDYLEIMDFCGFDLERADRMARELYDIDETVKEIKSHGVDRLEFKSNGAQGGRLRGESGCEGA